MTEANADLMAPIAEILNGSDKDLQMKVGVLIDSAAALLATSQEMRQPSKLRFVADEARKRLIVATRMHQDAIDARQENARAKLAQAGFHVEKISAARGDGPSGPDQPTVTADH